MTGNSLGAAKPQLNIIEEVETSLRESSGERRIKILMRVTDLFVGHSQNLSEKETKVFDDVMGHLIKHVESRALVELSRRLAPLHNAPGDTVRSLARNDAIAVAEPILVNSSQLDDADLMEIAKTKGQPHLASIASRARLNESVTEVLVDRGSPYVAERVASNPGAQLSPLTMEKLVMRADGDENLTASMSRRADIPPAIFRNLMLQATDEVRSRLLANAPSEQKKLIENVIDDLSAQVGKRSSAPPRDYDAARRTVAAFSQDTDLVKRKILEFARMRNIAALVTALSVLSGIAIDQVETLFLAPGCFGLLVLCKSAMLDWNGLCAILMARPKGAVCEDLYRHYEELTSSSAQQLLRFWVGRQKMAKFVVGGARAS